MRQSFVTVGSLAGSAVASMIFYLSGQSYVATFAAASVPPCLALVWLAVAFRKELGPSGGTAAVPGPSRGGGSDRRTAMADSPSAAADAADAESGREQKQLNWLQKIKTVVSAFSPAYWQALLVVSVLYFGRFDFTWVTLRAKAVRLQPYAWQACLCLCTGIDMPWCRGRHASFEGASLMDGPAWSHQAA